MRMRDNVPPPGQRNRTLTTRVSQLRRAPGFTLACVAFCLTVLMGAGSGYAIALWNQTANLTMQAKTETMPQPTLKCAEDTGSLTIIVSWEPQRTGGTSYQVTVTKNGSILRTNTYGWGTTSETIKTSGGVLDVAYSDTYTVTVTASYGDWQALPAQSPEFYASKPLLGGGSIDCWG